MLHLTFDQNPHLALAASVVMIDYGDVPGPSVITDPVLAAFDRSMLAPRLLPQQVIHGWHSQHPKGSVSVYGGKPSKSPYGPVRDRAAFSYGSAHLINEPFHNGPDISGENFVNHSSYKGKGFYTSGTQESKYFYFPCYDSAVSAYHPMVVKTIYGFANRPIYYASYSTQGVQDAIWRLPDWYSPISRFAEDAAIAFSALSLPYDYSFLFSGMVVSITLHSFSADLSADEALRCNWSHTERVYWPGVPEGGDEYIERRYHSSLDVTTKPFEYVNNSSYFPWSGTFTAVNPNVFTRWSYSGSSLEMSGTLWEPYALMDPVSNTTVNDAGFVPTIITSMFDSPSLDEDLDGYHSVSDISRRRRLSLQTKVSRELLDLLPATFYSTASAVDNFTDVLSANNVENLVQASGLLQILPDIGMVLNIIKDVKNLRLLSAGASIADLWSDLQLKWDYGAKPLISDVKEFSDKYGALTRRLNGLDIFGHHVVNGVFKYTLPDEFTGYGPSKLIVRTKVDFHFNHFTFLTSFLGGKAVGLVPDLSSLWDLVPFSFVVDWFTNLGERFEDIDDALVLFLMPCNYCVHSITVLSDFSDVEMEQLQIGSTNFRGSVGHPGIKEYRRIISKILPNLRESKYDFRQVDHPPSLATAGAFIYKMLR